MAIDTHTRELWEHAFLCQFLGLQDCHSMLPAKVDLYFNQMSTDTLLVYRHSKVTCWRDPGKPRAPRPSRGHPRTLACPLLLGLKQELSLKISRE